MTRSFWGVCLLTGIAMAQGWGMVYSTHFAQGIDRQVMVQGPRPDSVALAADPLGVNGQVLHVLIRRDDVYAGVANGVPRGEMSFGPRLRLTGGHTWRIRWQMLLPADYVFDTQQPEGIAQVHPGAPQSPPAWGLSLVHGSYQVDLHGQHRSAGPAAEDRGHWTSWQLVYRPGASPLTEVSHNGTVVFSAPGQPNAFDDDGYFKFGIYKWDWQRHPSDVTTREAWFSDVTFESQ